MCTRRVWTFDDLGALHIPLRAVYATALRGGDSLLWSPAFYSGIYLFGEGQAGMAHPLHLFLYGLLPLDVAFNLEILASYVFAAVGMRLLLPRFGLSTAAAWFGAMLFAFSGFNLQHLVHVNAVAVVAHAPWLLLATDVLITTMVARSLALSFAAVALLIGSQLLLGYPQYVELVLIAVAFLVLCRLATGERRSRVVVFCGAVLLGVFLGAVQWWPTLAALDASVRSAPTLDFRLSFSLPPWNLLQLWSPMLFVSSIAAEFVPHEFGVYDGAFCSLAVAWVASRGRHLAHRRLALVLLVFSGLCLVLALGRFAGVYGLLARLPGLSSFRAPTRHLVLVHLALSAIAAIVFDDLAGLIQRSERVTFARLWPVGAMAIASVAITLVGAGLAGSSWSTAHQLSFSTLAESVPWIVVMVVTAALMAAGARGQAWALPLLVVVAAIDLGVWGYGYTYHGGAVTTLPQLTALARVPEGAQPGDLYEAYPTGTGPAKNLGVLRGLRLTAGYLGLAPDRAMRGDLSALRISGAAWRIDGSGWAKITDTMPRARLVTSTRVTVDGDGVRAELPKIDVATTALIDQAVEPLAGDPGTTRVIEDRPGTIRVETTAPAPQLLIVTERYDVGWRATEDGRELQPIRVYRDFLGCVVSGGTHRVTLTFAPSSARNGLRLTLLGAALGVASTAVLWRKGVA